MKTNLIGKKFGKLTVLKNSERERYVVCRCECGNVKEVRRSSLTKSFKPTRSCGCIQREIAKNIGNKTIADNSKAQISVNVSYNTNFQVIQSSTPPKNNRSGHKGVWLDKKRDMWQAYINIHGKRVHLGRYYSYDDAVKARVRAEEELFSPLIESKANETH